MGPTALQARGGEVLKAGRFLEVSQRCDLWPNGPRLSFFVEASPCHTDFAYAHFVCVIWHWFGRHMTGVVLIFLWFFRKNRKKSDRHMTHFGGAYWCPGCKPPSGQNCVLKSSQKSVLTLGTKMWSEAWASVPRLGTVGLHCGTATWVLHENSLSLDKYKISAPKHDCFHRKHMKRNSNQNG